MNKHIEYEVKGSGIPFVFIHGLGGDMNQIYSAYDSIDNVQLICPQEGLGGPLRSLLHRPH